MALAIEHLPESSTEQAEPTSPSLKIVADASPTEPTSFARSFLLGTTLATLLILAVTTISWSFYRGGFWPGLGLGAYLAFWFAPAIGLIGGGTYWVTATR